MDFSRVSSVRGVLADGHRHVSGRASSMVYIDICGIPVPAISVAPESEVGLAGFQVLILLCSGDCAKAVCLASALDHILAGQPPPSVATNTVWGVRLTEPRSGVGPQFERAMELLLPMIAEIAPQAVNRLAAAIGHELLDSPARGSWSAPTPQECEWAQRVMGERCAWCLHPIADDAPVTALHVNLHGDDDHVLHAGGIVSIFVCGRRLPMHIPVLGAPASASGDAAFMLCSEQCASALAMAIDRDRSPSKHQQEL